MSTRSEIHYYRNGRLTSVYCHSDGDFEGVGETLFNHYQDPKKVEELVHLGDLSSLGENVNPTTDTHSFSTPEDGVTVAYGRDRGETGTEAAVRKFKSKDVDALVFKVHKLSNEEYSYVYVHSMKKWFAIDVGNASITSLANALGKKEPNKGVNKKPKLYISKEFAINASRLLRKNPDEAFVATQLEDGSVSSKFVKLEDFSDSGEWLVFNWKALENHLKRKPTQKELADMIYQQINTKFNQ